MPKVNSGELQGRGFEPLAPTSSGIHTLAVQANGVLWSQAKTVTAAQVWDLNNLGPLGNDHQGNARSSTNQIYQTTPAQILLP